MRAAIMTELNGTPELREVPDCVAEPGTRRIRVNAAGLQPTDIMRARGLYNAPTLPYVIGGEGVGRLDDGTRVYFGHSIASSGATCDWTVVPEAEIWPIPAAIDDEQAIALAIAGTGALIPLEEAHIQPGERVLVLGATGPLGQIALQLARVMGAGLVAAAARTLAPLERLKARGIADEIAQLGQGNDDAALKAIAGPGFDVVLDCIYGPPAEAAMRATAVGGRMMSIGVGAGMTVTLSLKDLVRRAHHGVSTGHRPAEERRAAYGRLLDHALAGSITVDIAPFSIDRVGDAWAARLGSPGGKVVVRVAD
jgi:NADPH2:quinone reductase